MPKNRRFKESLLLNRHDLHKKYHSQPTYNSQNTPLLKVHIHSHYHPIHHYHHHHHHQHSPRPSRFPSAYLLSVLNHILPKCFFQCFSYIPHKHKHNFTFWTSCLTVFTIWILGSLMKRSIRLFVNDEWSLEREAYGEGFAEGKECGVRFLAGFSAASRASLSTLSSFRWTITGHSISCFFIFKTKSIGIKLSSDFHLVTNNEKSKEWWWW